jgi:opacity protein-like surface antigen
MVGAAIFFGCTVGQSLIATVPVDLLQRRLQTRRSSFRLFRNPLKMKLPLLAAVAGLVLATGAAQAQIGVYTTPIFSRISNSLPDPGVFAFLGPNTTSRVFSGFGLGAYDDLYHSGNLSAGLDLRGNILRGNGAQLNSLLFGGRVAYKSPERPNFKPYAQIGIGVGSSKAATNPVHLSKLEYNVAAGLDYSFASHVDFRVIEIGYGSVQTISTGAIDQVGPTSNSQMVNFSTGLVFRFK